MFYNRRIELEYLESKFLSKEPELLIFWGRRRIGKTFLLKEFCNRKQGIFLLATTSSSKDNLSSFSNVLSDYFNDDRLRITPLQNWEEFFIYLDEKITQRTVIVIDEYPYLVESYTPISTIFQKYWDSHLRTNHHIMMVLNGSAISMMEKETLEYRSPLYGRRTGQWFLEGFDVIAANEFFQYNKLTQAIEAYSITGGTPYYCYLLGKQQNILAAIKHKILSKGQVLFEEVDFLLRQQFKSPRSYFPILKAIAQGARKFGEISSKTGYDKSNLVKYLSTLEKLKLIRRDIPITETVPEKSRKGLYFLNDNFINFWFNFVFPNLNMLESAETNRVMQQFVIPKLNHYVSQNVEPIIHYLLKTDYFNLGLNIRKIGRFWDSNLEIDIYCETDENRTIIGEIKWTNSPCSKKVYLNLIQKQIIKDPIIILVSKSGFEKDFSDIREQVILIDLSHYKLS